MAVQKTKAQEKAEAKEQAQRNPLTGQAPNTFTQVSNRTLTPPVAARDIEVDQHREARSQRARREAVRSRSYDAPEGYRLDAIEPRYRTFVTGAAHMFPNTAAERETPAINETHQADPGITVQRRAEDLSGLEYRKGEQALRQYGHLPSNPTKSLREVQAAALDRVTAEHIAAGVHESSSQMFYGGSTTTNLPLGHDVEQKAHEEGVMGAASRFGQSVRDLAMHPDFKNRTPQLTHRERMHAATNLVAQAAADTSPQNKWRDKNSQNYPWPNLDQADEVVKAAAEDRSVRHVQGRLANTYKAKNRADEAIDTGNFDVHHYGENTTATGRPTAGPAKTVAFRGALVDKDSPDAYKVSDVHEGSVVAPWLETAKSHKYERLDASGERVGHIKEVFPDTPKSQYAGMTKMTKQQVSNQGVREVPEWGKSHVENMLAKGHGPVHALNDRATREVLSERGLSRGVNYADNVHSMQAATWGSQQMRRENVNVSPADQYPVTRRWHDEGVNVPAEHHISNLPQGGVSNLSPQFGLNQRTGNSQSVWPEER